MDFRLRFCLYPVLPLPNTKVHRNSEMIEKSWPGQTGGQKETALSCTEQILHKATEVNMFLHTNIVVLCISGIDRSKRDQLNNFNSNLAQTKEKRKGVPVQEFPERTKSKYCHDGIPWGVPLPLASEFFPQQALASPQKREAGPQKEHKQERW